MKKNLSVENDVKPLVEYNPSFLNRGNLRNLVILLSCVLALFHPIDSVEIFVSFFLLTLGSFVHFVSKGILIRSGLTKCGIYGLVRHPYYMASYLVDLSFCLLSGNTYLLIAYPFLFFWTYGYAIRKEDELLGKAYPDTFFPYLTEIPSAFPDASSIRGWKHLFDGFSMRRISKKEVARLFRYWATALLIFCLHRIPYKDFQSFNFKFEPHHWQTLIWLFLVIILYLVNFIIVAASKKSGSDFELGG